MTSPAFSFYAKDWLAATLAWPLDARGAYVTLLAYQWDAGHIPDNTHDLARLLGVSLSKARDVWEIVEDKFPWNEAAAVYRNERLELERAKQAARHLALSENGAKGGRPKKPTESYRFPEHKADGNQNESLSSSSSFASAFSPQPPVDTGGVVRVRREHRDQAKAILRSRLGYCEHEPACANELACHERIALELAQKGIAS